MKKHLFSAAFFLIGLSSSAQFINGSKQWNVRQEVNFGPINTAIYKIHGDTVINSMSYQAIWVNEDTSTTYWGVAGYLREDSNRVYCRLNGQEGLLYDFNLQEGDTVYVVSLDCPVPQEKIVLQTDTVEFYGISRTRWLFNNYLSDAWIEGIGSISGPLNPAFPCMTDYWVNLLCFYEGDSLRYKYEFEDECYMNNAGLAENNKESTFSIFPNPSVHGSVRISSRNIMTDLKILDMNGVLCMHLQNPNSKEIILKPDVLRKGIYLIRVLDSSDHTGFCKFIRL